MYSAGCKAKVLVSRASTKDLSEIPLFIAKHISVQTSPQAGLGSDLLRTYLRFKDTWWWSGGEKKVFKERERRSTTAKATAAAAAGPGQHHFGWKKRIFSSLSVWAWQRISEPLCSGQHRLAAPGGSVRNQNLFSKKIFEWLFHNLELEFVVADLKFWVWDKTSFLDAP